ncbi:MAG TPA: cysteine desulfurase family protein, partial [Vicinamibacterales bacterium]|nr:cysteine desulfurase family protein [Vicinamibacterales bacterium]
MPHAPVYLDYHSTTPVDPRVVEAMMPYFTEVFGNPSSTNHAWGWRAQEAVERARREVATLLGAAPREIVFTSGATESNNLAIAGIARQAPADRRHAVVSAIEHKSVLERAKKLEDEGWRVSVAPVNTDGVIDLEALRALLTPDTAFIGVMLANNEIGVVQPLAEIAAMAHEAGALVLVDAAQAAGKIPIDVAAMGIDLLSLTGHKFYGPKGCGALFVRKGTKLEPLIVGGGHERGMRSGTLNVPGIVGLGRACVIAHAEMTAESARMTALRDRLLAGLRAKLDGVVVNGSLDQRLPNNLHVSFLHVDGAALLIGIGDIAVSSGSACQTASEQPSHVLCALLGAANVPSASIRFGLGRFTTEEEIDSAIEKFAAVVSHLRGPSPTPVVLTTHEDHSRPEPGLRRRVHVLGPRARGRDRERIHR